MHVFDIAWFSSAIAFAALIYVIEPFEPPGGPKGPLIPILIDGRVVRVPPAFIDAWSETSKFTAEFEVALQEAVPGLRSSSGTLWTTRIIRNKKPELVGALRGMDDLRRNHSALLDQAADAHDRGADIEEALDLLAHCEKQRVKMGEVRKTMGGYWPGDSTWTIV